eukprot:jgi/Astpho2/3184/fgenesh1_pg.00052_%23_15_t
MPTLLQPGTVRLEEQLAILEALQKEVQTRWRTSDEFGRIDIVVAELLRKGSPAEALSYLDRVRQLFDKIHAKLRSTVDEPAAEASGGNAGRFASTTREGICSRVWGASAAELAALRQQVAEQQSQLDQKDAMLQDLRDLLSARKTFLQESETQQAEMLEALRQQVETASMQLEAKDRTIAALQQMHTEQVERLAARAEQLEVALGAARASTELSRYDDEDVPDVDRAQAAAAAAAMQQREDAIQLPSPRWEGLSQKDSKLLMQDTVSHRQYTLQLQQTVGAPTCNSMQWEARTRL